MGFGINVKCSIQRKRFIHKVEDRFGEKEVKKIMKGFILDWKIS
jgi:hypothetical protein